MSAWYYLLALLIGGISYAISEWRKRETGEAPSSGDARPGTPPHPAARIVDLPNMRLIDLRWLPPDDLAIAQLGVVQQQLALERPVTVQIWVIDAATAKAWEAFTETAAMLVALGRLKDPRDSSIKNYVYVIGGQLSEATSAGFKLGGVETVLSMTNLSEPPKQIEDFLEPRPRTWTPSPTDRPLPACTTITTGPFEGELIHVIEGFAYIDFRRASPATLTSGAAIERVTKGIHALREVGSITHVVWVFAPWVLERLPAAQVPAIEQLVASFKPPIEQRLAVLTAENEPLGDHELTRTLGAKLRPLAERLHWKTQNRGSFEVMPIDSLHDAYYTRAWKQPHL